MRSLASKFGVLTLVTALVGGVALWADSKKKDPDQIGNRDVDGKVNFYSIEKEIALGKSLAQDVERQEIGRAHV